jgi:hypothetical protein
MGDNDATPIRMVLPSSTQGGGIVERERALQGAPY